MISRSIIYSIFIIFYLCLYKFIKKGPMFDIQQNSMMKTQTFMLSTLAPLSTPRKRYHNINTQLSKRKSVLSKTINVQHTQLAASFNKEHRAQLKTPNLPQLKKQKQFGLQEWLNQALEGQGDPATRQPLKTLKKYGLDKASLRNMQLSQQSIQKLYKGLFVYTSGIKNAFEEMLIEAQAMPRQDNLLPKMYFKAFIKLFQNIVPVKSCFQLLENEYIKANTEVKNTVVELKQAIESQKIQKQEMQRRLKKEVEDKQSKVNGMMSDYKIMESSLQLYQKSFEEEVELRLKFEEKINQTYSSYEELKIKYDTMKQELVYTRQLLDQSSITNYQSNQKMQCLTISNNELVEKIKRLEQMISQRQKDLSLKNQEILDIRLVNHSQDQKKNAQENAITDLINENHLQRKKKKEVQEKLQDQVLKNTQQLKLIEKLKVDLTTSREKNDEIYIKFHEATLNLIPIQKEKHQKDIHLAQYKKELAIIKQKNEMLQKQKEQYLKTINQLKIDLQNNVKDLSMAKVQIEKISLNIVQMREAKGKFERICEKLKEDLKILRLQNDAQIKQNAAQKQKNTELIFAFSALQKKANEFQKAIFNLKKEIMEKQQTFHEYKLKEQSKTAIFEENLKVKDKQIEAKNINCRRLMDELATKENDKFKKLEELSYLKKCNDSMQAQIAAKKNRLQENKVQIQKRDIQIEKLKMQLANRQFTLNKKKGDTDGEIVNLKMTIKNLKEKIKDKSQYVHPMIVEDLSEQIRRLHQKIVRILNESKQMRDNYESIQRQLKNKREQARSGAVEVNKLTQNVEISKKQATMARDQMKKTQIQFEKKMQERQSEVRREQYQIKIQKQRMNDVLRMKQNEVSLKDGKISELQYQIKILKQTPNINKEVMVTSQQTQTQNQAFQQKHIEKQLEDIRVQTDSITNGTGRKLTTSDKLRQKKGGLVQQQSIHKNSQIKCSHLGQNHEEKQRREGDKHKWHSLDRKIDDKQYKAALKFTYMRN